MNQQILSQKILLIDDSPMLHTMIQAYLKDKDFELLHGNTGEEGINLFKKEKPAIVLLDMILPDISGLKVLWDIKRRNKTVKVMMITGQQNTEVIIEAMKLGASNFLIKPLEKSALLQAIDLAYVAYKESLLYLRYNEIQEELAFRKTRELKLASKVQQTLLDSGVPKLTGGRVSRLYIPYEELAGDFYFTHVKDGNELYLMNADVVGHGAAASLFVAIFYTVASIIARGGKNLKEFSNWAKMQLNAVFAPDQFITFTSIKINLETWEGEYLVAGHPHFLHYKEAEGKAEEIAIRSPSITPLFNDFDYKVFPIKVDKGDKLLIFTDGVIERKNTQKEEFGYKRLIECFEKNLKLSYGEDLIESIVDESEKFSEGSTLKDDLCFVMLERDK